jgi:hypothetical protein
LPGVTFVPLATSSRPPLSCLYRQDAPALVRAFLAYVEECG